MSENIHVELLSSVHDRKDFSCGRPQLDSDLANLAGQWSRKRIASTWVMTSEPPEKIIGFYTLTSLSVDAKDFPSSIVAALPKRIVLPVTLIGRLAVGQRFQRKGLGEHLLMNALER